MSKKIGLLLATLAVGMLGLIGQAGAQEQTPSTLKVDDDRRQCTGAEFTSINEAIVAASPGDTIQVCPGLYAENVLVDKTLTLVGSGPDDPRERSGNPEEEAVVTGPNPALPAVQLLANDIKFGFFTVQETDNAGVYSSPLFSGYQIGRNLITDNTFGLYLHSEGTNKTVVGQNAFVDNNRAGSASGVAIYSDQGLSNARIWNNYFTGHESASIVLAQVAGTADDVQIDNNNIIDDNSVALFNTTNTLVEYNKIYRPGGSGIFEGGGSTGLTIRNNELKGGTSTGIAHSSGSTSEVLVEQNTLSDFVRGISLGSSNTNKTVNTNTVSGSQQDGIRLLSGATGNTVSGNTLHQNGQDGIRLSGALNNTVETNTATKNVRDGIRLENESSGNTLTSNEMLNNVEHDAHDDNRPANTWVNNKCKTDFPPGTICGVADSQSG